MKAVQNLKILLAVWAMAAGLRATDVRAEADVDPPEVQIGERLFLETRFAQFFAVRCNGDVNATLSAGDPAVAQLVKADGSLIASPFAGQSMNCRACHLVDDVATTPNGGFRTYADFARRSPIPAREDGLTLTTRNSPPLVNATLTKPANRVLHFDGEFPTITDLVKGTLTGRNYGWLPGEHDTALKHVVNVIRHDNGSGDLAKSTGGPYRLVFAVDDSVPDELKLPDNFKLDVTTASDEEVFDDVARLVAAYVHSLIFSQDAKGAFNGSPYDLFLKKNKLPQKPRGRQTDKAYGMDLLRRLSALPSPKFVGPQDGTFKNHAQPFLFGPDELKGLMIFLSTPSSTPSGVSTGNCIACHAPPRFTDFSFHNTGVSQKEYDSIHGNGSFMLLPVPKLDERTANPEAFLPANGIHPHATGIYRSIPSASDPRLADLGVWNIYANPDYPASQKNIETALGFTRKNHPNVSDTLDHLVAAFKTPGLRDLADSEPYLHSGTADTLEAVMGFYLQFSALARAGQVRNADTELSSVSITAQDIITLSAFLRALTEDYN